MELLLDYLLAEDGDEAVHVEDESGEEIGERQFVSLVGLVSVAIETVKDGRIFQDPLKVPQGLQVRGRPFLFRQQSFPLATHVPFRCQYL